MNSPDKPNPQRYPRNNPRPNPAPRIRQEQRTIDAMLHIYCTDHHGTSGGGDEGELCEVCERLRAYAHQRLQVCPFQEEKPVCNRCEVHCYSREMRAEVRSVMRYAGPRMPLRHPWLSLLHVLDKLRRVPGLKQRRRPGVEKHQKS